MNNNLLNIIIVFLTSVLFLVFPTISQADQPIKIYDTYIYFGIGSYVASPLLILDNEKQYKDFTSEATIVSSGPNTNRDPSYYKHRKIDFDKQCLVLLNAPAHPPEVSSINLKINQIVVNVEYSDNIRKGNGWFMGRAVLIEKPDVSITLSEESLNQHEKIYGKKLKLYRNSLNYTANEKIMSACSESIEKIFNDILKLRNKYDELKDFSKKNRKRRSFIEMSGLIYYENYRKKTSEGYVKVKVTNPLLLQIYYTYPIEPYEYLHDLADTFMIEYENICARICACIVTDNKQLQNDIKKIIKKHATPLENLNEENI